MNITEIATLYPEVLSVFRRYGMGWIGCMAAQFESLGQGAEVHGVDADQLVADLNAALDTADW